MKKINKKNHGFGIIEVVIACAILTVGLLALISSYGAFVSFALANQRNVQASYLLEEGLEGVSFLRDKGWTADIMTLSTSTTYYLNWNGQYWATTTTPVYVDGEFLRTVKISDVKRDSNDDISSVGTYEANTKQITATVSYKQGTATTTRAVSTYIANIYAN